MSFIALLFNVVHSSRKLGRCSLDLCAIPFPVQSPVHLRRRGNEAGFLKHLDLKPLRDSQVQIASSLVWRACPSFLCFGETGNEKMRQETRIATKTRLDVP